MTNFHYFPARNWYKGSLHLHSTRSDGHLTVAALTKKYAAANFDFIALTDHWQVHEPAAQKNDAPLLVLDGTELDGSDEKGVYYHVVVIGAVTDLPVAGRDFRRTMAAVKNGSLRRDGDGDHLADHLCPLNRPAQRGLQSQRT